MDCSLLGSSVHGISQARILEWVAISFSRGSSWFRDQTHVSCIAGRFFTILYHWGTKPPFFSILFFIVQFSSVQFSRSVMCDPKDCSTRLSCPSPATGACSNPHPSSRWCHQTISSSVVHFSSCLQSSPPSGSFPMSQLFVSGGQSIGVSASASVLPMNIQDWFPLGLTGLITLQSDWFDLLFFFFFLQ